MASSPGTLSGQRRAGSALRGAVLSLRRSPGRRRSPERGPDLTGHLLRERYELHARIGQGASGTVYRGYDRKRERRVAIKVLHRRYTSDRSVLDIFKREAHAAERMVHPNLVQVYGYSHDPAGHLFIVMELLEGRTLEQVLRSMRAPRLEWTISVVTQLLSALDAAHDAGVVHRDTKPANVLLIDAHGAEGTPRVKLCDFGVARIRRASGVLDSMPPSTVEEPRGDGADDAVGEKAGLVWGTPEYMAPEQACGHSVRRTADIYACGVILFEMLAGGLPPRGASRSELAGALQAARPDLDPELHAIVLRAMAHDPDSRFRNAQAMRSALLMVPAHPASRPRGAAPTEVHELPSDPREVPVPTSERPRGPLLIAAALLLLLIAGMVWLTG